MRAAVYEAVKPSADECGLALLTIALLRENGVSDADIIKDYTNESPQADRAYELQYYRECYVRISAARVKVQIRRLLHN